MCAADKAMFALPEAGAADICRRLGLVIGNAAMYGMEHSVTVTSQAAAYDALVALLDLYGEIEWSSCDNALLVNGKPIESLKGTGLALLDQLRRANIHAFAFCTPLDRREFARFLAILAAERGSGLVADGVVEAVRRSNFRTIRVDDIAYERVGKPKGGQAPQAEGARRGAAAEHAAPAGRVFDLDSDLEGLDMGQEADAPPALDIVAKASRYIEQRREIRRQHDDMVEMVRRCAGDETSLGMLREELLAAGLSQAEWTAMLAEGGMAGPGDAGQAKAEIGRLLGSIGELAGLREGDGRESPEMAHALEAIGRQVEVLIQRAQGQAGTLAKRVDADRETVAEIEQSARARGVGLQLSREELLASLAEINQEMVQPLTASSALLEVLASGKSGEIPEEQRDILRMAIKGMGRLESLIACLQRISGLPSELIPDREVLDDVYARNP